MSVNNNDVVRLTLEWVDASFADQLVNVFHVQNLSGLNYASDANYMLAAADWLRTTFLLVETDIPNSFTAAVLRGQNLTQARLMPDTSIVPPIIGTHIGERMPRQVTPCVFFRTTVPRKIGKVFLPSYTEGANNSNGTLNAAAVTRLQSFGDALMTQFNSGGILIDYVVYNRLLAVATKPSVAVAATDWRTQRRRRPGVGS